ncbi:MAG: CYTH domain-containing protein [Eubacterium sp.]|nr:CYTH domain-containing protein [Eubacterium sp.]
MEIELKYLLKDRAQADEIFSGSLVKEYEDEGSFETIDMQAIYYDTPDRKLTAEGIALRVRKEGGYYVATMKDKGNSIQGMHKRREINVRLSDEEMIKHPDVTIFKESDAYDELVRIAGKGSLAPVLEMTFERRQVRVDTGKAISVLSCDDGHITAGGRTLPIMELEIELYSGDVEELREYGQKIAAEYGLTPEDRSKFARGYDLLK